MGSGDAVVLRDLVIWGAWALGCALVLLAGIALANRRLLSEIGRRRAAEADSRASEAIARQLLDASSDACMLFDLDGTLRVCNQVFAHRFGIDAAQASGSNLWDYFPPEISMARREAVARVAAEGRPVVLSDQRGGHHLSNSIYPLRDQDGVVRRIAVYSRDVTEQAEAERRIASYVAEIERSNEDLEQFATVVSHDLREPLRQVASYVALLERRYGGRLDDDAREFIALAREGAHRMDRLILDLLDYARIGRGETLEAVESEPAVRQAIANLRVAVADSGGLVHIAAPLPRVLGTGPQLVRLFQNLVGNSLKYCRAGVPPRVNISAEPDGDFARFTVADNGIGIEADHHERIFGIFQRLHGRDEYQGTGIGLAICRKVVERHGGDIWLDSVPGQGSRFHFRLLRSEG